MSKERLNKVRGIVFKCKYGYTRGYSVASIGRMSSNLIEEHGDWLVGQAERVEDLERDFMYYFKLSNELDHQIKRYRERLELIKDKTSCVMAASHASKALEVNSDDKN